MLCRVVRRDARPAPAAGLARGKFFMLRLRRRPSHKKLARPAHHIATSHSNKGEKFYLRGWLENFYGWPRSSLEARTRPKRTGCRRLGLPLSERRGVRRKDCMQSWRHIDTRLAFHDIVNPTRSEGAQKARKRQDPKILIPMTKSKCRTAECEKFPEADN